MISLSVPKSTPFAPLFLILHDRGHEAPRHVQSEYEHEHYPWMRVYAGDLLNACAHVNEREDGDENALYRHGYAYGHVRGCAHGHEDKYGYVACHDGS